MPERSVRRRLLRIGLSSPLLAFNLRLAHAATVVAVRVWPARDYTRITLELDRPLKFTHALLANPPRLMVDLEEAQLDPELRDLVAKVQSDDPFIAQVRVGQNRPGVVRIVFDLKTDIEPRLFALDPVADYNHRVVIDLYPLIPRDPLQALLESVKADAGPGKTPATAPGDPLAALIKEQDAKVAAQPGAAISPPAKRREITRMITIAIDAGHGGEDPGAIGRRGTREKDVVLAIAQELRQMIGAARGVRAFMTRDGDYFVPLATRVYKARRVQADLFVSIHADAFVEPQARGASVYVLSEGGASSTAARWLASRENRADQVGGVDLGHRNREAAQVVLDLSTSDQIRQSSRLGGIVLAELRGVGRLHKPDVERAGFAVLRAPDIPSILVETAFISNPQEEGRLSDPRYQRSVARAVFDGLQAYLRKHPPPPRTPT